MLYNLLVTQEGHPQVVQQLPPVLLGEGAGIGDEGCSEEDVATQRLLLFVVLSHRVGPAHVLTLKQHTKSVISTLSQCLKVSGSAHLQAFDQSIGQFYRLVGAVDLFLKAQLLRCGFFKCCCQCLQAAVQLLREKK